MSPTGDMSDANRSQFNFSIAVAVVLGLVGCLTLAILFAALFGGLWLDNQLDSKPIFTVGLLIVSVPVTLIVMFWVVRKVSARYMPQDKKQANPAQEDENRE
jgi:F0F1-type ATP synthase assembly protein I